MPCDEGRADRLQGCLVSAPATSNASSRREAASKRAEPADSDGDGVAGRPTVTRVTPTALELHKKKEQDRRAKELLKSQQNTDNDNNSLDNLIKVS